MTTTKRDVSVSTAGFASPYDLSDLGGANTLIILNTANPQAKLDLHLDISTLPTTTVVDGDFDVHLFTTSNDASLDFGSKKLILKEVASFGTYKFFDENSTSILPTATAPGIEMTADTITIESSYSLDVFDVTDTTIREAHVVMIDTQPAQSLLNAANGGAGDHFMVGLAGVNLVGLTLSENVFLSNFNPCMITHAGAASSVVFETAQKDILLSQIDIDTNSALTLTNKRIFANTPLQTLKITLEEFVKGQTATAPKIVLRTESSTIATMVLKSAGTERVVLDCDVDLQIEQVSADQPAGQPFFILDTLQLTKRVSVVGDSNYNKRILDCLDVHVGKGAGAFNPAEGEFLFEGTAAKHTDGIQPVADWSTALTTCVLNGLVVQYNFSTSRVIFDKVILVSDVLEGHTTKTANVVDANYGLTVRCDVVGAGQVPVLFQGGDSVLVVQNKDAYGVMLDSRGEKRHVRLAGTSYLRSFREYTLPTSEPITNVGVVFVGADTHTAVPLDIGLFDMSNMWEDDGEPDVAVAALNTIVFGTSAMSVKPNGESNLGEIVKKMTGQGAKWISRMGHHLTSWKADDAPVLYRKLDQESGRKILFQDMPGAEKAPMRHDLTFILGLADGNTEFTGANGGLVGVELEVHSNAHIDALHVDNVIDDAEKEELLDELEKGLFGFVEGAQTEAPPVGIAGYMNSEQGGYEVVRVFNAQPIGEFSIKFEADDGFNQPNIIGQPMQRYYYLGDTVVKARFLEHPGQAHEVFGSSYLNAHSLPPFTYQLIEADEVDAYLYYTTADSPTLHQGTQVTLTTNNIVVRVESDHAFLLPSSIWVDYPLPADESGYTAEEVERNGRISAALQVNNQSFASRLSVRLAESSVDIYNFTYVASDPMNLRHSSNTSGWPDEEVADVRVVLVPYMANERVFAQRPTRAAPIKNSENLDLNLKADISVNSSVPNVFVMRRSGEQTDSINSTLLGEYKLTKNATEPELFPSTTAKDAEYLYNSTNVADSVVVGEKVRLGLTMFSPAIDTYNTFLTTDIQGYTNQQLFAIIPEVTDSKLYPTQGQTVNTFTQVSGTPWNVTADSNCSVVNMELAFANTYPNGQYKVLVVENTKLGNAVDTKESEVVTFDIEPRSTDQGTNMASQIMGQIMAARFHVVPLKKGPQAATTSASFKMYAKVPTAFRMSKPSDNVVVQNEKRFSQFNYSTASPTTLTVDFVAKPKVITEGPDLKLKITTITALSTQPASQFRLEPVSQSISSTVYDRITPNSSTLSIDGKVSGRRFQVQTVWDNSQVFPDNNRVFLVELESVRTEDGLKTNNIRVLSLAGSNPSPSDLQFETAYLNWYTGEPTALQVLDDLITDTSTGGGGGSEPPTVVLQFDFNVEIRSSSRLDATEASDAAISRRIGVSETVSSDNQVYSTPTFVLRGNPPPAVLSRKLASISERVWVGTFPRQDVRQTGTSTALPMKLYFTGEYVASGTLTTTGTPKFYTSYSGGTLVTVTSPVEIPASPAWRGAWLDVSDLVVNGMPGVSDTIRCDITMHLKTDAASPFSDGVEIELGRVDLTDAGRVELVDMSGTQLSSIRIGNWTLYSDAAGDLRAQHRTFISGEGSGVDAGVVFSLTADSVEALKNADGTEPVDVVGAGFRLTGHANVVV